MTEQRFRTVAILIAIVGIFAALNIGRALSVGALSVPTVYDDNAYLWDAFQRVVFEDVRSLSDLIRSFVNYPPHAPIETLTAMAGFYVFGPHNYGAYIMNVWGLLAFSVGTFLIARRRMRVSFALLLVTAVMFTPAVGAIMTELRPDMIAATFFAFSGYWLIHFKYDQSRVEWALLLGTFIAFSMIIKLSAAIITIPMLGFAWFLGLVSLPGRMKAAMSNAITVPTVGITLLIPVAYLWGLETYAYIKMAVFTQSDIWNTPGTWLFHATYNSLGFGGTTALSAFVYVGIVAVAADFTFILARRGRRGGDLQTAAYYLWCGAIYFGTAVSQVKNQYQGSFFYFPFLVATIVAISRGVGTGSRSVAQTATAVIFAYAFVFMPPSNTYQDGRWRPETPQMLDQISDLVLQNYSKIQACGTTTPLFTTANSYPITAEAVGIDVGKKDRKKLELAYTFTENSIEKVADIVSRSNFVLFPNMAGLQEAINQRLPGVAFLDEMIAKLRSDQKWSEHRINVTDAPTLFIRTGC